MRVSALHIYPLKSGAGRPVQSAVAGERGFDGDRRLMAVDDEGTFLSQRTHPRLGHVVVEVVEGGVRLTSDGRAPLKVDGFHSDRISVTVWGDTMEANVAGSGASDWLSELLGESVRLVRMPEDPVRHVEEREVQVSFADGYPYLLANTASLQDLNERIDGPPVPMRAFRPNIVVDGAAAWAEDDWSTIRVGEAEFEVAKPCTRCKIPTLDPDAPDRPRADGEPLRTLATFRRRPDGGGVLFGENLICRTPGVAIRVGDAVAVID